jgi:putative redox protein
MYADRKRWPLEASEVRLTHEKIHCKDCEDPDRPSSKIDHFTREISLEGTLDEAQRKRLLAVADRCPVHRTLKAAAEISTTLVE